MLESVPLDSKHRRKRLMDKAFALNTRVPAVSISDYR